MIIKIQDTFVSIVIFQQFQLVQWMIPQQRTRPPILVVQPYEIIYQLVPNCIKFLLPTTSSSKISDSHLNSLQGMPFLKYKNIEELKVDLSQNLPLTCCILATEIDANEIRSNPKVVIINHQRSQQNYHAFIKTIRDRSYDISLYDIQHSLKQLINKGKFGANLILQHTQNSFYKPEHLIYNIYSSEMSCSSQEGIDQPQHSKQSFIHFLTYLPHRISRKIQELRIQQMTEISEASLQVCNLLFMMEEGCQIWMLNYVRKLLDCFKRVCFRNKIDSLVVENQQVEMCAWINFPANISDDVMSGLWVKCLENLKENQPIFINSFIKATKKPSYQNSNPPFMFKLLLNENILSHCQQHQLPINRFYKAEKHFIFGPMNKFIIKSKNPLILQWVQYPLPQLQKIPQPDSPAQSIIRRLRYDTFKQLKTARNRRFFNQKNSIPIDFLQQKYKRYLSKQYEQLRIKQNYFLSEAGVDLDSYHNEYYADARKIQINCDIPLNYELMRIYEELGIVLIEISQQEDVWMASNLRRAKQYLQTCLILSEWKNVELPPKTYLQIASLYIMLGEYSRGLVILTKYKQQILKDRQLINQWKLKLAKIYNDKGEYRIGMQLIEEVRADYYHAFQTLSVTHQDYFNRKKRYFDIQLIKLSFLEDILTLNKIYQYNKHSFPHSLIDLQWKILHTLLSILFLPTNQPANQPKIKPQNLNEINLSTIFMLAIKVLMNKEYNKNDRIQNLSSSIVKTAIDQESKKSPQKMNLCVMGQFWRCYNDKVPMQEYEIINKYMLILQAIPKPTHHLKLLYELIVIRILLYIGSKILAKAEQSYTQAYKKISKIYEFLEEEQLCSLSQKQIYETEPAVLMREQLSEMEYYCVEGIPSLAHLDSLLDEIEE